MSPVANLGTLLDDGTIRICAGLRVGAKIVLPHTCTFGHPVTADASQGLSCLTSAGSWSRHFQIDDTFSRALRYAHILNSREPPGRDGRTPDGVTLIPFERGGALTRDPAAGPGLVGNDISPRLGLS